MSDTKATRVPKSGKPTLKMIQSVAAETPTGEKLTPEERKYFKALHTIIDEIYERAKTEFSLTWSQLAGRAGVGYMTVCCLGERRTRFPQFRTVYKLAKAVGWDLVTKGQSKKTNNTVKMRKAG